MNEIPHNTSPNHLSNGKFRPGHKANINGNSRVQRTSQIFAAELRDYMGKEGRIKKLIQILWGECQKKKPWAIHQMLDRLAGKPKQEVDLTNRDGSDINQLSTNELTEMLLELSKEVPHPSVN